MNNKKNKNRPTASMKSGIARQLELEDLKRAKRLLNDNMSNINTRPYRHRDTGRIEYKSPKDVYMQNLIEMVAILGDSNPVAAYTELWTEVEETEAIRTLYGPTKKK